MFRGSQNRRASEWKDDNRISSANDEVKEHRRVQSSKSVSSYGWIIALLLLSNVLLLYKILHSSQNATGTASGGIDRHLMNSYSSGGDRVLVSYSYFEKDMVQVYNAQYFLQIGVGLSPSMSMPDNVDFFFVANNKKCSPCVEFLPELERLSPADPLPSHTMTHVYRSGSRFTILYRIENEGMDFGAHNMTLEWLEYEMTHRHGDVEYPTRDYRFYVFLNSSVRGPFVPTYMPKHWRWTDAFTDRLSEDVLAVGSSLTCLPEIDAGGPGPRLESWAFALNTKGLAILQEAGIFHIRECKTCDNDSGIIVRGEYGITKAIFKKGYNVATLLYKYASGIDWKDESHWACNNNVHPSRHGTYDTVSMNPFETVFIKSSWSVGQPFVDMYTLWLLDQAEGMAGTEGEFDYEMYRYAISEEAQKPTYPDACYDVLKRRYSTQVADSSS